mmetsp:Transcript_3101/g.9467  ORF Transcript_3101/g.9467 Transcript_3101/m.9467 type:complete len:212 (+) Transcript_3101:2421-3056(+)
MASNWTARSHLATNPSPTGLLRSSRHCRRTLCRPSSLRRRRLQTSRRRLNRRTRVRTVWSPTNRSRERQRAEHRSLELERASAAPSNSVVDTQVSSTWRRTLLRTRRNVQVDRRRTLIRAFSMSVCAAAGWCWQFRLPFEDAPVCRRPFRNGRHVSFSARHRCVDAVPVRRQEKCVCCPACERCVSVQFCSQIAILGTGHTLVNSSHRAST